MTKKHTTMSCVDMSDHRVALPIQEESCPWLNKKDNYNNKDDDDDSDGEDETCQDSSYDPPDDSSYILDIDYHESYEILGNSFSSKHLSLNNHVYPNFGNQTSDSYFEQDFKMHHDEDELFGGMRGICWRSRYKLDLHDVGSMATMAQWMTPSSCSTSLTCS